MRKLLNNRWFVAALAVGAIIFVVVSLAKKPTTPIVAAQPAPEEPAVSETPAAQPDEERVSPLEALKQLGRIAPGRDPFAVRASTEQTSAAEQKLEIPDVIETVKLSAIWTQNAVTFVVINGQVHAVGDAIGRIQIETAGPDGVWFSHPQGRSFVATGESFTLKTPGRLAAQPSSP